MELHEILIVLWCLAMAIYIFRRESLDALIEAINNRRGGPPRPMHPSPVNDGALLRRRSRKADS
jgi:hypothetical protein